MTFSTAIRSCFTQYAGFTGRARRSEYWYFVLFDFLVCFAATVLDAVVGGQVFSVLTFLGLILPWLAVTVRRLHDTGRSGWWVLIALVPFGGIVLLVFACLDSQPHPNRFGPSPKQPAGGWAPYGQAPYGQPYYGQPYPQQAPYGQPPYGQQHPQQPPYGQSPYGQQPYPQPPRPPTSWS